MAGRRGTLASIAQVAFHASVVRPFMTLFIGLRVRGREHLPASDPFLLVANHSSHLDTVALQSLFPLRRLRRIRAVAAADYFERTRLRSVLSRALFNTLPIDRHRATRTGHPVEAMRLAIEAGDSLILFPEGTRGQGRDIAPFRTGVAALLERVPGLAAHPVYLRNLGRSLPKGEVLPVPFFCEVACGPPLRPEGSRERVAEALRAAVLALADPR
ncbi:MAG: lysophospholipid acyltransferase family protein [Acidobacteriota bacterium]